MINSVLSSSIFRNGIWGLLANILQTFAASLFFILIARFYSVSEFGHFILASTICQIVVAFSTMGLGQWFIREYLTINDKRSFTAKFLKIQMFLGFLFYAVNVGVTYLLYEDSNIRILGVIIGVNIIFDNIIFVLSRLNIAEGNQKKTAVVMALDGLFRLSFALLLFTYSFSLVFLSLMIIGIRLITLNVFIRLSASYVLGIAMTLKQKIFLTDFFRLVILNWRFIVIGTVYILNWRLANVIISKNLPIQEVGSFEISFRILTLALILPTITVATLFPLFINLHKGRKIDQLIQVYNFSVLVLQIYSMLFYSFIFSYGNILLQIGFGNEFFSSAQVLRLMFGCLLFTSTASLQANMLIAMNHEGLDMKLNVSAFLVNIVGGMVGLYFFKSIMVPVYCLLASVVLFHLLQDIFLVKKGILGVRSVVRFYLTALLFYIFCYTISLYNQTMVFYAVLISTLLFSPFIFRKLRFGLNGFQKELNLSLSTPST